MRTGSFAICWVLTVAAGWSATAADYFREGIVQEEFIYETAPFPQCHASTIVQTEDGKIVAAWFGGTREKHPDVGIWLSRRVDQRWTAPVEVANGVESADKRYPCWNPVLFQPARGPLLLFYKVGPSPSTWWGVLKTSNDGGQTWSAASRLPDGILGPIKNKPVELPGGKILCGSSTEHAGWRVHFEWTTDLGKTWSKTEPVNDPGQVGAIQPALLVHPDGAVQAVGRSQQGKIWETWSRDQGATWSPMSLTGAAQSQLRTGRRHAGRRTARAGVQSHAPRPQPVECGPSADGKKWQAALVLEREPGEYSYPAVIQARGRDDAYHLHLETAAGQARGGRPGQVRVAGSGRWPMAAVTEPKRPRERNKSRIRRTEFNFRGDTVFQMADDQAAKIEFCTSDPSSS